MSSSAKLFDLAISDKVKSLIEAEGLGQNKVAHIFNISPSSFHNKLSGKGSWSALDLFKVSVYFGVTFDDLLLSKSTHTDEIRADIFNRAQEVSEEILKVAEQAAKYLPKGKN